METILKNAHKTVIISPEKPTVLIGERINPTGRKRLAAALAEGNLDIVRMEAEAQVEAGADVLDVNGVNCPIVDAAKVRPAILATDLLLGRDEYAMRYIKAFKKRRKRSR